IRIAGSRESRRAGTLIPGLPASRGFLAADGHVKMVLAGGLPVANDGGAADAPVVVAAVEVLLRHLAPDGDAERIDAAVGGDEAVERLLAIGREDVEPLRQKLPGEPLRLLAQVADLDAVLADRGTGRLVPLPLNRLRLLRRESGVER